MPRQFFAKTQPAAVLKHGILRRYLPLFVSKTGMVARGHRVWFLDGYAGPGAYESGAPGSPLLAERTASEVARFRNLHLLLVEKDQEAFDRLCATLADSEAQWQTFHGPIEDHLDEVLSLAATEPLFAFLDPFGMCLPFDMLVGKILGRGSWPGQATEVYLNFSLAALRHMASKLKEPETEDLSYIKARETILRRTDEWMGGGWWRDIWLSEADDREEQIAFGYAEHVAEAGGGWGHWIIEAPDRWKGPPAYYLMHFTRHRDGAWGFHQAVSGAMEDFYAFCNPPPEGQEQLMSFEEEHRLTWVAGIESNIEKLLTQQGPFRMRDRINEVFGEFLGLARDRHVRQAIKGLHARGITATTGVRWEPKDQIIPAHWGGVDN